MREFLLKSPALAAEGTIKQFSISKFQSWPQRGTYQPSQVYLVVPAIDGRQALLKNVPMEKAVIVAVHGTWSSCKGWPASSPLISKLRELGYEVDSSYSWTGINAQLSRVNAVPSLAEHLRNTIANHPGYKVIVVCHSHGGNIGRAALNLVGGNESCILITLGTPFLNYTPGAALIKYTPHAALGMIILLFLYASYSYLDSNKYDFISKIYNDTSLVIMLLMSILVLTAAWVMHRFTKRYGIWMELRSSYFLSHWKGPTYSFYTPMDEPVLLLGILSRLIRATCLLSSIVILVFYIVSILGTILMPWDRNSMADSYLITSTGVAVIGLFTVNAVLAFILCKLLYGYIPLWLIAAGFVEVVSDSGVLNAKQIRLNRRWMMPWPRMLHHYCYYTYDYEIGVILDVIKNAVADEATKGALSLKGVPE